MGLRLHYDWSCPLWVQPASLCSEDRLYVHHHHRYSGHAIHQRPYTVLSTGPWFTMATERPQYYKNTLKLIEINPESLQQTLQELRDAARRGAHMVREGSPPPGEWGIGGCFLGNPGITLAFLRLAHQAASLKKDNEYSPPDFQKDANERIYPGPDLPLLPSRLSPLGSLSPIPAAVLRILAAATSNRAVSKDDIQCFHQAVELALKNGHIVPHAGNNLGGDEILYGRAGLLWSILNIRAHQYDEDTEKALKPLYEFIPKLVDVIIEAGRQGALDCAKLYGDKDTLPLMYMWMEKYYCLGAVHGAGGILSTVLACNVEEVSDGASRNYFPWIAETITGLCKITIAHNGHLPTCIPPRQVGNPTSPLIQVCHGSPSFLLLMACARRNAHLMTNHWQPEWDQAIQLATERIWEEGLLSKGGGLCHGISGNAWSVLLMHDCFEYDGELAEQAMQNYKARTQTEIPSVQPELTGDYFLSRALSLMLHVRETRPYNTSPKPDSNDYRMPDNPYALTEGLPGPVCAWSESCVVIQARLRKMELDAKGETSAAARENDAVFQELESRHLGFPTLPYHRAVGMF